jgi:hypothetical protein
MANFNISGTISPNGANATVTLTGTVAASTVADANGVYTFSVADLAAEIITPTKVGVVFTPTTKAVTLSGADSTGNNFTGVEVPIESFAEVSFGKPGREFVVVDNGPAITTVPTAAAGVPKPNNPGASTQEANVYPNGPVPDFIPTSTVVTFGVNAQPIKWKNPA